MAKAMAAKTKRIERWMRKRGWSYKTPNNGLRRRLWATASSRNRWRDWGHYLMIWVGTDFGGNWSEPDPPTWYYREDSSVPMKFTGYPQHPRSTYTIIKDYTTFMEMTHDLNEDQMYIWKAFCWSQDRELHLGHQYWGGRYFGLSRWELPLLKDYVKMSHRYDWYGARSWLYSLGLHATVKRFKSISHDRLV